MNVNSPANVSGLAYALASDLWDRQRNVDASIRTARMNTAFGPIFDAPIDYDTSGHNPGFTLWVAASVMVVIVRGTRTAEQALRQGRDWGNPRDFLPIGGMARTAGEVANAIYAAALPHGIAASPRVILFGHSYGGEIATALYGQRSTAFSDGRPTVITIGSPRVCFDTQTYLFSTADMRRYNFYNDPFPRLPFQGNDGTFTQWLAWPLERGYWARWRHVGQGCTLNAFGIQDYSELPNGVIVNPQSSLVGLLTGDGGPALIAHSPDTYRDSLLLAATADGSLGFQPTISHAPSLPTAPESPPTVLSQPLLDAAVGVVENQRAAQAESKPLKGPFTYKRLGRIHAMMSGDAMVLACTFRKSAQSNVKFWNQVYSKWNKANFGDLPALIATINSSFAS